MTLLIDAGGQPGDFMFSGVLLLFVVGLVTWIYSL